MIFNTTPQKNVLAFLLDMLDFSVQGLIFFKGVTRPPPTYGLKWHSPATVLQHTRLLV